MGPLGIGFPFPPMGPHRQGPPASSVLWVAPTPRLRPAALRFLRLAVPPCVTWQCRLGVTRPCLRRVLPVCDPFRSVEISRFSQVPGESLCACLGQATPARPVAPGRCGVRVLPSGRIKTSALTGNFCSRGSITRPTHSLSTLRRTGRPYCHARLASGWGPALSGRMLSPRDSNRSFSSSHPLPPSFAWRTMGQRYCCHSDRSVRHFVHW